MNNMIFTSSAKLTCWIRNKVSAQLQDNGEKTTNVTKFH